MNEFVAPWKKIEPIRHDAFHSGTFGNASALNLNYTPEAQADLEDIHAYISQDASPRTADRVVLAILQSARILESFPFLGRTDRVADTRELVVNGVSYVAIYEIVSATDILVLEILHTSRLYPPEHGGDP